MSGFFTSTPSFLSKIAKHIEDGATAAKNFSPSDAAKALQEKAMSTHEEFLKEHDRYMRDTGKEVSDRLPWEEVVDPKEEAIVKRKILALSKDERSFIEPPPEDTNFHFVYDDYSVVAMKLMEADPDIGKARFALVPRKVKEVHFWRNYFYRISLIVENSERHGRGDHSPATSPTPPAQKNAALAIAKAYEQALDAALDEDECFDNLDDDVALFASEEHDSARATTGEPGSGAGNEDTLGPLLEAPKVSLAEVAPDEEDDWEKQLEEELNQGLGDANNVEDGFQIVDGDGEEDLEERLEAELNLADD